jgi:hypothetical protein
VRQRVDKVVARGGPIGTRCSRRGAQQKFQVQRDTRQERHIERGYRRDAYVERGS